MNTGYIASEHTTITVQNIWVDVMRMETTHGHHHIERHLIAKKISIENIT